MAFLKIFVLGVIWLLGLSRARDSGTIETEIISGAYSLAQIRMVEVTERAARNASITKCEP
jgi:hypothetical protein